MANFDPLSFYKSIEQGNEFLTKACEEASVPVPRIFIHVMNGYSYSGAILPMIQLESLECKVEGKHFGELVNEYIRRCNFERGQKALQIGSSVIDA